MSDDAGVKADSSEEEPAELTIRVSPELYRAYQRCCWIINHETERDRSELAGEMVTDFLIKYGC